MTRAWAGEVYHPWSPILGNQQGLWIHDSRGQSSMHYQKGCIQFNKNDWAFASVIEAIKRSLIIETDWLAAGLFGVKSCFTWPV